MMQTADILDRLIVTNIHEYGVGDADCENICLKARVYGAKRVLVGPSSVAGALKILKGSVECAVAAAYPSGAYFPEAKAEEVEELAERYPQISAFYPVMAVGLLLSGKEQQIRQEMKLVKLASKGREVHFITEAATLSDAQMKTICDFASDEGISGIVSSTGFKHYDVSFPDQDCLKRLVSAANGRVAIAASGALDSFDKVNAAIAAGVGSVICASIDFLI